MNICFFSYNTFVLNNEKSGINVKTKKLKKVQKLKEKRNNGWQYLRLNYSSSETLTGSFTSPFVE